MIDVLIANIINGVYRRIHATRSNRFYIAV